MAKKIIAILLIIMLCPASVFAATSEDYKGLLQTLEALDWSSSYPMDSLLSRAQFTKMAVMVSTNRESVATNLYISPFVDVTHTYWATPYIHLAVTSGIVSGYKDGYFRPEDPITYEDALTISLRILGYKNEDFGSSWPYGQIGIANQIGLSDNINSRVGEYLTRSGAITLFYNLLSTKPKGGNANYIENLGYKIIEDATVIATSNEALSVGANKVYTSAGTFKTNSYFNYDIVGMKGAIVTEGDEFILFFPNNQICEQYNIYSVVGDNLVLYRDGQIQPATLDLSTQLYYQMEKTTISAKLSDITAGDSITVYKDSLGNVDYALLRTNTLQGPITVKDGAWQSSLGVPDNASVVRDSVISSLNSIRTYDVVYYSVPLNTVWAYSKKVTGIYEKALPSREQLSTATISGVNYKVNSVPAFVALGAGGTFSINSTVTALLGKDGSIVDVVSPQSGVNTESYTVYTPLANDVLVYKDGAIKSLGLPTDTTVYSNGQQTTLKGALSSLDIGYVLTVCRNSDNTVDYITVQTNSLAGPFIADTTTISEYKNAKTFMRDGLKTTLEELKSNDVLYYSEALSTVWAYSKKVSGIYESAYPNKDTPTSVTVSGQVYSLEGASAYNELSSNGSYKFGDTITLLLGRKGDVAGVASPSSASASTQIAGYLIDAGRKQFINSSGNTYTSLYATVVQTDGKTYDYTTSSNYSSILNSVVTVTFSVNNAVLRKESKQDSVSGKLSSSSMTLGNYTLAPQVEILDISTTISSETPLYKTIFPQRLDGITLSSGSILYCAKNSSGQLTKLILNNYTGDMYTYGIVTKANVSSSKSSASYTYITNDNMSSVTSGSLYSVSTGQPAKFIMSGQQLSSMIALNALSKPVSTISETALKAGSVSYPLSDRVIVYEKTIASTYNYLTMPLSDLIENQDRYTMRAYMDKDPSSGGRIRVIVVEKK